jgi:hypothetical protein
MTQRIAYWIAELQERLQGRALAPPGQGEESSVFPTLAWPEWVPAVVLIAVVAWTWWNYRRERGPAGRFFRGLLIGLRIAAVVVLLFMLQGWMLQRHRTDLPELVVLLDVSGSMSTRDAIEDSSLRSAITKRLSATNLDEGTRLDVAKLLLLENDRSVLTRLQEKYRLKVYAIGETATLVKLEEEQDLGMATRRLEADAPSSRLGKCLRDVLEAQRGRPTSAVILLSDGINTEGRTLSDAAEYARRKTIPLYLVGIGNDHAPRDLRLADLLVESEAFVNDLVHFDLKLSASAAKGQQVKVVLRRTGESAKLAEETVTIDKDYDSKPVRLMHRPNKEGDWEYEIAIETKSSDANPENDRLTTVVHVHNATIRVLLVQAGPSYEFRFLKTMLERELNPNDEGEPGKRGFQVVLQDADVQFADTDKSALRVFPVTREELFAYDVILFGDANPSFFSQTMLQNVADFVKERGGGIVFIAGPRFNPVAYRDTPLASILPIDPATARIPDPDDDLTQEVHPRPTALGLSTGTLLLSDSRVENVQLWAKKLPGMYWWVETPHVRPGVRVLLEHPTKTGAQGTPLPLLSLQFVGSGKVMFQAFDGSYRWRFRAGDEYFARYWIQTIRFLSRAKVLGQDRSAELSSDREEYQRGEPVLLRLKFLDDRKAPAEDDGVSLMLERPGSPRRTITARRTADARGVFEATLTNLAEGRYRAWLATPSLEGEPPAKEFLIVAPPNEQARLEMDAAELKSAAKLSAGKFYTFATAGTLPDDLPPGRQVRIESLPPRPLWNSPLLAGVFVLLLVVEWLARKKAGML